MARLADILRIKYPHLRCKIIDDDYETLVVSGGDKPPEAEIRAYSTEVDGILANEELMRVRFDELLKPEVLMEVLSSLFGAVEEIRVRGGIVDRNVRDRFNNAHSLLAKALNKR